MEEFERYRQHLSRMAKDKSKRVRDARGFPIYGSERGGIHYPETTKGIDDDWLSGLITTIPLRKPNIRLEREANRKNVKDKDILRMWDKKRKMKPTLI